MQTNAVAAGEATTDAFGCAKGGGAGLSLADLLSCELTGGMPGELKLTAEQSAALVAMLGELKAGKVPAQVAALQQDPQQKTQIDVSAGAVFAAIMQILAMQPAPTAGQTQPAGPDACQPLAPAGTAATVLPNPLPQMAATGEVPPVLPATQPASAETSLPAEAAPPADAGVPAAAAPQAAAAPVVEVADAAGAAAAAQPASQPKLAAMPATRQQDLPTATPQETQADPQAASRQAGAEPATPPSAPQQQDRPAQPVAALAAAAAPKASAKAPSAARATPHVRAVSQYTSTAAYPAVARADAAGGEQVSARVSAAGAAVKVLAASGPRQSGDVQLSSPGAGVAAAMGLAAAPAAASAAGAPAMATPVAPGQQVLDAAVTASLRQAGDQVVVRLDPPDLGSVRLMLSADGDGVRGVIESDNRATLVAMQRETPAMIDRLNEAGVNVKEVQFIFNQRSDGNPSGMFAQDQQAQRQSAQLARQAAGEGGNMHVAQAAAAGAGYVDESSINVWM